MMGCMSPAPRARIGSCCLLLVISHLTLLNAFSIDRTPLVRHRIPSRLRAETLAREASPYYSIETTFDGPQKSPVHTLTFHSLPHLPAPHQDDNGGGDGTEAPSSNTAPLDHTIAIQTGKIGRQAAGAVTLTRGDSVLYATAARDDAPRAGVDFVPLSVDYQERFSAAGMTSGAFHKRDGRPAEHEILTARLMDRPLRPLIDPHWRRETQLLAWVLSYDGRRPCDTLAVIAAATALYISDVPLLKPVAAVQVGLIANKVAGSGDSHSEDGDSSTENKGNEDNSHGDSAETTYTFVLNPTIEQMETSRLNLILAGTEDAVLMIEGAADFLPEATFLKAIEFGQDAIRVLCQGIQAFAETVRGAPKQRLDTVEAPTEAAVLLQRRVDEVMTDRVDAMYAAEGDKAVKGELMNDCYAAVVNELGGEFPDQEMALMNALKDLLSRRMYLRAKAQGLRADNRHLSQIRDLYIEAGFLPKVHGSALFTRGETQTIATTTLGDAAMRQKLDKIDGMMEKRFYLQYTFPPSCVGETGRFGAPGRREVGHGNLAERALIPILPSEEEFPYTIRLESLITESHGSSSMASVCGGCLSLMDAGVPIKRPVAGIAMGMLLDHKDSSSDEGIILSDISGTEDALGMMDFKVAGDREGITTFQLDIKCEGLTLATMERALEQARVGRLALLDEMLKILPTARTQLAPTVPKIISFTISPELKGKIIGPGGKQVRAIIEDFNLINVDVDETGRVQVSSFDADKLTEAVDFIKKLVNGGGGGGGGGKKERSAYQGPPPVEGAIYKGKITGIHAFGVFVEILPGAEDGSYPGLEGLVHISELAKDRIRNCEGYIKSMGAEELTVKYIGTSKDGKLKLSRKAALEELDPKARLSVIKPNGESAPMSSMELEVIGKAIDAVSEL